MTVGRRGFLKGALALPAVAAVGAQERFLVGHYGAPAGLEDELAGMPFGLDWGLMAAGIMMYASYFEKHVEVKKRLTAEATRHMMPTMMKMLPEAK